MALDKTKTYKPKDALIADGRVKGVKAGRGRLSADAKVRLAELVQEGYRIEGYAIEKTDKSVGEKPTVKKVNSTTERVIAEYVIFWDMDDYKAIDGNGKEWGMAEVCNNCRVSLVQCHCGNPRILGDILVSIVPR